jgi:hypothetical protein
LKMGTLCINISKSHVFKSRRAFRAATFWEIDLHPV